MKTMYECEKCGSRFENYDDCLRCEGSHIGVGYDGYNFKKELDTYQTWKKGDIMPRIDVIVSDDIWSRSEETGQYETTKKFALYKLDRLLTDKETAEIYRKAKEREQEERERFEQYLASKKEEQEVSA